MIKERKNTIVSLTGPGSIEAGILEDSIIMEIDAVLHISAQIPHPRHFFKSTDGFFSGNEIALTGQRCSHVPHAVQVSFVKTGM